MNIKTKIIHAASIMEDHLEYEDGQETSGEAYVHETLLEAHETINSLTKALEGMMEWARRVKGPNPGLEPRNATVALMELKA